MTAQSREPAASVGESVVRALAELGAIVALTVLGGFLMVAAAHGHDPDMFLVSFGPPGLGHAIPGGYDAPHTLGSVLTLVALALGLSVLVAGAVGPTGQDEDPAELMDPFAALSLS